jgi:dTDP-glucose 4,6-dehydratase/UDP-glucose 4-epimerase
MHPGGHYEIVPFPGELKAIDIGDYYSDFTKARQTFGWLPQVSLREGLQRSIQYYVEYGNHYW